MRIAWNSLGGIGDFLRGRSGRHLREVLTGYLMISPALLLIFVFGIFPVFFALYVSLHRWLIVRDEFRGIDNYVAAIDNFAYLGLFALGIGALVGAYLLLNKVRQRAAGESANPWLLAIPAALHAAVVLTFVRWVYYQLPEFLDIASKMRGLERTRELFIRLLSEAFFAGTVYPAWQLFSLVLVFSIASGITARYFIKIKGNVQFQTDLALAWLSAAVGFGLIYFNFAAIANAYAQAIETETDPGIWPQLIMVVSGIFLLALAWRIWRSAERQGTNRQFAVRILGAILLMVAAVMLIIEIPSIIMSGNQAMWNGLKVTVFFSFGTVPVQLTIALFLAVLLFQRIRGASVFRVLFFLPYVTPAVASATVFKLMFSDRQVAPANKVLELLGIQAQAWLRESRGILSMAASALGVEGYPSAILPAWLPADLSSLLANWLTGPSMALMVVLMLSVWTFVGYNVVIYLAGLGNIPSELTEAAEIDGANKWDTFRHITFPLLSPTTYFLSLIGVMGTFKAFNTIWVLRTGQELGTINTFSVVIFEEFFLKTRYGYASALAFVLFAIILSLTYINNRVQGSRVFYG